MRISSYNIKNVLEPCGNSLFRGAIYSAEYKGRLI
jgi:hypothetical protein